MAMRYSQAVLLLIALSLGSAFAQDQDARIRLGYDHGKPTYFTPGFYTLADGLAEAQRIGKHVLVLYDSLRPVGSPQGQVLTCINFDQRTDLTEALAKLSETCVIVRLDPNALRDDDLNFGGYPQFLVLDRTGKILVKQSDHNRLPDLIANLDSLQQASQMFTQDLTSALEQARTQDKPVLVNVYTSDYRSFVCQPESWCTVEVSHVPRGAPVGVRPQLPDVILSEVWNFASLSDPGVASRIQQDFVACEVDGSQERGFMQHYRVLGYPTLLFLSPEGEEIARLQGVVKPEQILAAASEALASYRQGKIPEPFIVWEDPWIAFERAHQENKPVFLLRGDPWNAKITWEALLGMCPEALRDLRQHFVCLYLPGTARDTASSTELDGKLYFDHQPWIVRVDGREMPEQCFEHLLENVYVPITEIPKPMFDRYVLSATPINSGLPMRQGTRVLSRKVWVGTGLEELGIRDRFGERVVYFLDGQQAVNLVCRGGLGGFDFYVLDPDGNILISGDSFLGDLPMPASWEKWRSHPKPEAEETGKDYFTSEEVLPARVDKFRDPEFYEVVFRGALRLWYGEDGFGIRDIGTALAEAQETGKHILLCMRFSGATTFETQFLFEELRDALQQFGYIPAFINSASWRIVDLPGVGRMPEWRAWMELQLLNKPLQFAGWPTYCILAQDGSLVGGQIPSYVDTARWIAALQTALQTRQTSYPRDAKLARQVEQEWRQVQQAFAQGNWDLIEQMHQNKRVQVRWSNVEGPYTLILMPHGFSKRDYDLVKGAEIEIPAEFGKRLRERQLMTEEEIEEMMKKAGGPPRGGRRSRNNQGQEIIEVDAP